MSKDVIDYSSHNINMGSNYFRYYFKLIFHFFPISFKKSNNLNIYKNFNYINFFLFILTSNIRKLFLLYFHSRLATFPN